MLKALHWKLFAVLLSAIFTLNSCSEKQDVNPSSPASTAIAQVKAVNGRLIFVDQKAFDQVQEELFQKTRHENGSQELDAWEKSLQFTSLRAAARREDAHLEELEIAEKSTPAHDLIDKFGFPDSYAVLINRDGEYQIGAKIYWYSQGFKYEVGSETELSAIKREPTLCKIRFKVESYIVKSSRLKGSFTPSGTTASLTSQSNNPYAYDKYTSNFNYQNDSGSPRRIIYATRVYTEYKGSSFISGKNTQIWYTSVSLLIKYEYYSFGRGKWYPLSNEPLNWKVSINFTGTDYIPYNQFNSYSSQLNTYLQGNFTNGLRSIELANQTLYADANYSLSSGSISWGLQIIGYVDCDPQYDFAHRYLVGDGSTVLW